MRYLKLILILTALAAYSVPPATPQSADPGEPETVLAEAEASAELDARARRIGKALRCVVCQNQSINDSRAPLAGDMRKLVRERLEAGATDQEVIDFMVERYGNFVLLNPPLQTDTLLLWFGPAAFILLAGLGWYVYNRQPRRETLYPEPLDDDESRQLKAALSEETKT